MLCGPYARASAADTARIVQCADDGGDWKQLCATLQVNPKTAYVWVRAGAEERRPTAGGRCKALTEEQVDALCLMVEEDPFITLNALKERLLNDFEVRVSVLSSHNYLEEGTLLDGRCKQPAKQGAKIRVRSADKYAHVAKKDYHLDG